MNPNTELAHHVIQLARTQGHTIATAESLTAGWVAATLASVPGASAVLRGGLIVYATDLKHQLADVDPQLLATHGPVDATVATQLARGAAQRCSADWGIALTGVAGPEPQGGHPVGDVYLGLWSRNINTLPVREPGQAGSGFAELHRLAPDPESGLGTAENQRNAIRARAVDSALQLLSTHLDSETQREQR